MLESISDAFYALDADFRFVYVNRKAEQLWGRRREELLGRHYWTEFPKAVGSESYRMHLDVMTRRVPVQYETVSPLIGQWIDVSIYPTANGGLSCYFRDISDRKRIEARDRFLIALDDAVRPLIDPSSITSTVARLLAEHLEVDRCAYAEVDDDAGTFTMTGSWSRGLPELPGTFALREFGAEFVHLSRAGRPYLVEDAQHDPRLADVYDAYRAAGIAAVISIPLLKGERFVAGMAVHSATPRTWTPADVELVRLVASRCWESIERARVSRVLREREEHLGLILDNVKDHAIVTLDTQGRITSWNPGAERLFGYPAAEVIAHGASMLFAADDHDAGDVTGEMEQAASGVATEKIRRYLRKDRSQFFGRDTTNALRDEAGRLRGFVKVIRDVSEQQRIEEQRERLLEAERTARSAAERVARMKDEFLATISHELRTPLNAILGWAHILTRRSHGIEGSVREGLTVIERNARAQARLVDDLLDVSRIVTGKIRLDVQPIQLPDLLDAALDAARPAAEAKGIALDKAIDSTPIPFKGDPTRLQQVFWNLLTNAVKFTPAGGRIDVTLQYVDSRVEVRVIDTGQGISPEFLPHVFQRFRQADASTTRPHTGLGLGLAIVRQLVELHGGSVTVESPGEGAGTTFTVSLPLTTKTGQTYVEPPHVPGPASTERESLAASEDDSMLTGVRVLVVEDEPDARAMIRRVLEDCEAHVDVADSVPAALTHLVDRVPDILVSDIGMPHHDGYELIQKVRSLPTDRGGAIPAIALTAFARPEDRRRAITAGYQMHISKPVEPSELIAGIKNLVGLVVRH